MKTLIVVISMSLLLSCSHGYWTRPDFDESQWRTDSYYCQYNAELICYANLPLNRPRYKTNICVNRHFSLCIQAKGYHWENE